MRKTVLSAVAVMLLVSGARGGANVSLANSVVTNSAFPGMNVQTLLVGSYVLTNNLTGLRILSAGELKSIGNNILTNNGTDLAGRSVAIVLAY